MDLGVNWIQDSVALANFYPNFISDCKSVTANCLMTIACYLPQGFVGSAYLQVSPKLQAIAARVLLPNLELMPASISVL